MLKVNNLSVSYGGIHAVKDISFEVPEGKIVTLIGSNGAGKTSTLRAISGLIKVKGSIKLFGNELVGKQANKIVESGIVMSPEGRRVFADFTVEENLLMGAYIRKDQEGIKRDMEFVYQLFPRLLERQKQKAGNLSGGEQQMLAVGRALLSSPKLLMLDEPSLGLAPLVCEDIFRVVKEINEEGVTVLLVEQNAKRALELSDYAYVLETGIITLQGTGEELMNDPRVQAAYLGE
ncbi:MAG: ABC transporter ATP-binding protein [Clostridium sp.]|nr:ABC transporter ATP-binding protein [Clostridium sp.]